MVVLVYVLQEGSWHHIFLIDLWLILVAFWEVFGLKTRETQVPKGHEKTALKKVMQAGGKVTQDDRAAGRWLPLITTFNPSSLFFHIRSTPMRA